MPKVSALLRGDFTNLSGLATWKWQKNMLSGQSGNMPVVSSIAPCGSPVADFFPADGFDDAGELADALGDPFQFVGGDLVTRRVACIDIGAFEAGEAAPGLLGIARPGIDQAGVQVFGLRAQTLEPMRLRAIERQHQQNTVVEPFGRLMQLERREVEVATLNQEAGRGHESVGSGEEVVEVLSGLGLPILFGERHGSGKGIALGLVEGNAVAGDVDEEGAAEAELAAHVFETVDDEVDGSGEPTGDGQLAHQPLAGAVPEIGLIGEALGVDDDEQVVVGAIAALAIVDPVAARVRSEQDQLEDAAVPVPVGEFGLQGLVELLEEDLRDAVELAAFGIWQMVEAVRVHRTDL